MRLQHMALLLVTTAASACGAPPVRPLPVQPLPAPAPEPAPPVNGAPVPLEAAADDRIAVAEEPVPTPIAAPPATVPAIEAMRLQAPPFRYQLNQEAQIASQSAKPRLKKRLQAKNDIIDDQKWFDDNQVRLPVFTLPDPRTGAGGTLPNDIAESFAGMAIVQAIDHGDHHIALYANDYSGGRKLVVTTPGGEVLGAFDFSNWSRGPKDKPADSQFTEQGVVWAQMQSGVLYVTTGHRTYADSSGGLNAYLSAIDMQTGNLLWQSEPLVANARNFLLRDGWVLTGYGFTAEPDFMYVVDMKTGRKVATTKIKSGPNYILERDGRIYVRTYNTNYEFEIR